jgi:hypothetical protein
MAVIFSDSICLAVQPSANVERVPSEQLGPRLDNST